MSGVQRWEHRVDELVRVSTQELLDIRSAEGWELVAVTSATDRKPRCHYWKRPYAPEATR